LNDTSSDVNPFDGFLSPIAKGFLVASAESLEVGVVDSAWYGEDQGAKQVEEGGLSFANRELGQDLV
jgi:hypothetical protein